MILVVRVEHLNSRQCMLHELHRGHQTYDFRVILELGGNSLPKRLEAIGILDDIAVVCPEASSASQYIEYMLPDHVQRP